MHGSRKVDSRVSNGRRAGSGRETRASGKAGSRVPVVPWNQLFLARGRRFGAGLAAFCSDSAFAAR
ncbi:hypothetical protein H4W32_004666 [Actinophytocola algeriensis]|uniref:Uncharacterized protein n=1 Tax=Actinophytocola algeriensis TaxID=1768010 RepID=A0A7W7Q047_9PSEU|nr:hypothetical protein [Actinophytocola algeriensis]MBE1476624.1 hypothetical protein [Actinophytocola algeriensis]